MLESNKCYVLDCGAEIFVWMGRITSLEERKAASILAEVRTKSICSFVEPTFIFHYSIVPVEPSFIFLYSCGYSVSSGISVIPEKTKAYTSNQDHPRVWDIDIPFQFWCLAFGRWDHHVWRGQRKSCRCISTYKLCVCSYP